MACNMTQLSKNVTYLVMNSVLVGVVSLYIDDLHLKKKI